MKTIQLFHNPKAGDEQHSREHLTQTLTNSGYNVVYTSAKDPLPVIHPEVELIVIAGGDGTVRKLTGLVTDNHALAVHQSITILPLGTANNIAKTFDINGSDEEIIASWKHGSIVPLTVGDVKYSDKSNYFVESTGFGLFPFHIAQMKAHPSGAQEDDPEDKMKHDLTRLMDSINKVVPVHYDLQVDGKYLSGDYIMVEVMNMRSIGTNLLLSPRSQPTDDMLELVLVTESEKDLLREYVQSKLENKKDSIRLNTVRGKEIMIKCTFSQFHIDDELISAESNSIITISSGNRKIPFLLGG